MYIVLRKFLVCTYIRSCMRLSFLFVYTFYFTRMLSFLSFWMTIKLRASSSWIRSFRKMVGSQEELLGFTFHRSFTTMNIYVGRRICTNYAWNCFPQQRLAAMKPQIRTTLRNIALRCIVMSFLCKRNLACIQQKGANGSLRVTRLSPKRNSLPFCKWARNLASRRS